MSNLSVLTALLTLLLGLCTQAQDKTKTMLFVNHTGYHSDGIKKVILQTTSEMLPGTFELVDRNKNTVYSGKFRPGGKIDNWHTGKAYAGYFSEFSEEGQFYIKANIGKETVRSFDFKIDKRLLAEKSLELLIEGFESQHPTGEFEAKDKEMSFFGEREDIVDVSGGWYDASGDRGKYLSHLCYSNYFNPQQSSMIVWNLLESINHYSTSSMADPMIKKRMYEEAVYGADFLMRMQDKEGYFYTNVFANWSWDPQKREICAYEGQEGIKTEDYKAGFREGAGIAIAALAKASQETEGGAFSPDKYLKASIKGFDHLLQFNKRYIDNGKENIIDDYCILMAATELYIATNKKSYLKHAQERMQMLINKLSSDDHFRNWWRVEPDYNRPFFHGVEAGLPIIALSKYLAVEENEDMRSKAIRAIRNSVDFELAITNKAFNPFGYPRQYVKAIDEKKPKASFFVPHNNETGYWWQGENSRLASLFCAFELADEFLIKEQKMAIQEYKSNCINWILGLNPYNVCMVDGLGKNNPDYKETISLNFKGGVCNGITSGFTDENDIAFMPLPQDDDPSHKWRWSEQWMPHASWFMLAASLNNSPI